MMLCSIQFRFDDLLLFYLALFRFDSTKHYAKYRSCFCPSLLLFWPDEMLLSFLSYFDFALFSLCLDLLSRSDLFNLVFVSILLKFVIRTVGWREDINVIRLFLGDIILYYSRGIIMYSSLSIFRFVPLLNYQWNRDSFHKTNINFFKTICLFSNMNLSGILYRLFLMLTCLSNFVVCSLMYTFLIDLSWLLYILFS